MQTEFTQKMKGLCDKVTNDIVEIFKDEAIEAHIFGSIARGANDALSDVDIWVTFEDSDIQKILENRFTNYAKVGQIVLWHEMQNNFPLDGVQSAVIYKIDGELIRVDYYLCPFSSSRVLPDAKILLEKKHVSVGDIIPETKRNPRDLSDRITFFICMCFNGIKKVVRGDESFIPFLTNEFQKSEKDIPALTSAPKESNFQTIRKSMEILETVSNTEQKKAIFEIRSFLDRVESQLLVG
ncbi:nucleotidyltransferase domain-containing protein [Candidatus Campbellbacteria bacterium]|nr:MAG: nucleotidyltransferase domain-containing protein [Candidatus Campbellbacteria bacterium]